MTLSYVMLCFYDVDFVYYCILPIFYMDGRNSKYIPILRISHSLKESVLLTLTVSAQNVRPDQCICTEINKDYCPKLSKTYPTLP